MLTDAALSASASIGLPQVMMHDVSIHYPEQPMNLGAKESWRVKAKYLRLVYCGACSRREYLGMIYAEMNNSAWCRGCGQFVEFEDADVLPGYWRPVWFVVHAKCRSAARASEALDCQKIDADCNDCKHFAREKGDDGQCLKFLKPVRANPMFSSGYACFEHRREL